MTRPQLGLFLRGFGGWWVLWVPLVVPWLCVRGAGRRSVSEPCEVYFFAEERLRVLDVACGLDHTLVLAEELF